MKKKYAWRLVLAALAITAALVAIFVTIAIITPRERTTKAQRYGLDCVTELRKKPLNECKE